jgi:hypothetical protein
MNTRPTPETDSAYTQSPNEGAWDFRIRQEKTMERLERERDDARRLAEKYRNLSCETQDEADATLLPWEVVETKSDRQSCEGWAAINAHYAGAKTIIEHNE